MRAAIPLLLFMTGVQGWVLSLPLFGPVLFKLAAHSGQDPVQTASLFLNCYSLSFVLWGVLLYKARPDWKLLLTINFISILLCLLLNLSLLGVHSRGWSLVFAGIGLFASLPSLSWLYLLKKMIPGNRLGFAFAFNGVLVTVVNYTFKASQFSPVPGLLLGSTMLVIALLTIPRIYKLGPVIHQSSEETREHRSNPIPLYLFIFIICLLGGIMYQVVNPFLAQFPAIPNYYEKLVYLLALPIVGRLMDRQGIRAVIYGMAFLGLAYTVYAFSSSFFAAFLGSTAMQIGFAFLDVFVLYALATWIGSGRPFLFLGLGLGLYLFSIRVGLILNAVVVPASVGNYKITYLIALCILLISFLLVHWLSDAEPKEMEKKALFQELSDYYNEKDEELKLAGKIQQQMLPDRKKLPEGVETSTFLAAAREVGGDFYDVIALDDKRVLFVIGDVTDKGLPAALIMSKVIGLIRSEAYHNHTLPDMIKQLNRVLYSDSSFMLVTLGLVLVDKESDTLTYASAGHVSPYLIKEGRVETIPSSSFPIGVDSDIKPFIETMPVRPDDTFVLYTDGIIEVRNSMEEMYGFERLELILKAGASMNASAEDLQSLILSDVKTFADQGANQDDMTLVVIKLTGYYRRDQKGTARILDSSVPF